MPPWQNFSPEKENTNILWIFISLKPFLDFWEVKFILELDLLLLVGCKY